MGCDNINLDKIIFIGIIDWSAATFLEKVVVHNRTDGGEKSTRRKIIQHRTAGRKGLPGDLKKCELIAHLWVHITGQVRVAQYITVVENACSNIQICVDPLIFKINFCQAQL